jgi:hypothetical protein
MPIVPILCGVLLIGGIVALVLSATTWRWYHITLGSLIMLLSLVWFYLASRTLEIQANWRGEIAKYETALATEQKLNEKLINGGPDANGLEHLSMSQLQTDLEKMLQGRGRVWPQVAQKAVAPDTGKITALVNKPDPSGIEKNMLLYVFDDVDVGSGGQFLGEFEVSAVSGQEVQLTPALKLRPSEYKRFVAGHNDPLILYEVMPTDSHDLFAEFAKLNPKGWLSIFPASVPDPVKEEYAKDGQPPQPGDTQANNIWRRVKALKDFTVSLGAGDKKQSQQIAAGTILELDPQSAQEQIAAGNVQLLPENNAVYVRPLRDYVALYRDLNLQIEDLLRSTAEIDGENAAVQDSQQKVAKDIEYRTGEIAAVKRDLARFLAETDMIKNHVVALLKQVAQVNGQVDHLENDNRKQETRLNDYQHQAATEINRRVQAALTSNKDLAAPTPSPN